jgi:potassium voltage-gated channel Eag-related subfamily H member 2
MICLLYTASVVPYRCAFYKVEEGFSMYAVIEVVVDTIYIMDLFINFFISYLDKDRKVEVRLSNIAREYLYTWFIWDLLACIPF